MAHNKLSLKNLKTRKTPMLSSNNRGGEKSGKSGLGFTLFMYNLFKINETIKSKYKMSDKELADKICEEFKEHPRIVERFSGKGLSRKIALYRSQYNRGTLCRAHKEPPAKNLISFRYIDGKKVNAKTNKPLTEEEANEVRERYLHPR